MSPFTKGNNSGWIVITTAWAMAVFVGAYRLGGEAAAQHLNPAVTVGLAVDGATPGADVPVYIMSASSSAPSSAQPWSSSTTIPHWAATSDPGLKLAVFATGPAIRSTVWNLVSEIIGTFVLMFGILAIKGVVMDPSGAAVPINMGALGIIPVAFLVWVIGLALGGTTGYAINPARDLGPRIAHAILPIPGKGSSDWGYSWIPVVGPIVGAVIAALLAPAFNCDFHLLAQPWRGVRKAAL